MGNDEKCDMGPRREKYWKELTPEEKIERLKNAVESLPSNCVERIKHIIADFPIPVKEKK